MSDEPTQVVETPAETLQRLSLTPDVPASELRKALQDAVNDIIKRLEKAKRGRCIPVTFTAGIPGDRDGS